MQYKSIGVIGGSQGIGKWLVNFFQQLGFEVKYTTVDGLGDFDTNSGLVAASDVIFLAVPISTMPIVLDEIFTSLSGKLLIDVCSVKSKIVDRFVTLQSNSPDSNCRYLSLHPMFGPSVKEIAGQVVLFNYTHAVSAAELEYWRTIFENEKAEVFDISYVEHDKMMGIIQGLNHFNVFVSAKALSCMGGDLNMIKKLSSPTYRIFILFFTRYVLQNPRLYAEIQIFNPYVREVVLRFMDEAQGLLTIIDNGNLQAFEDYIHDIRPFFEKNQEDVIYSDILIDHLGTLMAK
jgi:prephenate dehydrogenase